MFTVAKVGRTPTWCSSSCRHRAWEASNAATRGLVAVQIVSRTIDFEVPVIVTEQVQVPTMPRGAGWARALHELAHQLDVGKVYDRDVPDLLEAINIVITALGRRPGAARLLR